MATASSKGGFRPSRSSWVRMWSPSMRRLSRLPGTMPIQSMAQVSASGKRPLFLMWSQTPVTIESSSKRMRSLSRMVSVSPPHSIHQ